MYRVFVAAIVLTILSVPTYALIEREVGRSFPVGEQASLVIDSSNGNVEVKTVPGARTITVTVRQSIDISDTAEGERQLALLDLRMEQTKTGAVRIVSRFRRGLSWAWQTWPPVHVSYEISVPARCDVDIRASDGVINLGSVKGRVRLETAGGAIYAQEVDGDFTARSRTGAVGLAACTGDIAITTGTSSITVGRTAGRTSITSNGGFIEVQRASGRVEVRGNGSDALVGFVSPIRDAADITLSGGTLTLRLDNDAESTLDLRSSVFGEVAVRGELPMRVSRGGVGKSSLLADINGGGPVLTARTHGGSVLVRALEPAPVY